MVFRGEMLLLAVEFSVCPLHFVRAVFFLQALSEKGSQGA